ncbi:MAG TPA: type II toxin-antitoxin system VapC family toxin [Bacteroidales bacterium]|mgnify:FL=1|nr:type II toxin-antitoxin system VapC family toxin [Bacteroidales bacterium]
MGKKYLLDTNTVIDYMGNKLPESAKKELAKIIDDEINLSVINKIELLGFAKVDQDFIDFVNFSNIYQLDEDITELTIELRKKNRIKLPDAIVAATALYHGFTLVTNNTSDFDKTHVPHA